MIQRVFVGVVVVAALIFLILYSQMRTAQPFVSGIIESDEIRLGSRVGGRVKQVFVKEGDRVDTGQRLIEFEPYDLLEREKQALAELGAAEANLKRLKTGLRKEEVAQAQARMDQLEAQLKLLKAGPRPQEIAAARERLSAANSLVRLAKRDYDRIANLAQSNAISEGEIDAAKEKFDGATANVEVKKNELAILEAGSRLEEIEQGEARFREAQLAWEIAKSGFRVEEIEQAEAAKNAAAAALDLIRKQKSELTIIAPSNGFIDALDLQPGDLVGANAPVLTLLANQDLRIRAYVPQRFLQLSIGQAIRVTVDSIPDEEFKGTVSFISHQAEFTPSNVQTSDDRAKQVYRIRLTIDQTDQRIRAGMTANVWLPQQPEGTSK